MILRFDFRDVADQEFFDELYRLATTDHQTGLLNKATILRSLNDELVHLRRYRRRLSVVLIDLDDFKSLNDTYGHLAGDRVLQATAGIIRRNLRRQDKAGRFGGEEFLIVVPETGLLGTKALAERIRRDLEQSLSCEVPLARVITASMGVAASPMDGSDAEPLLERADAALYRAKARGKNRVECSRRRVRAGTGTAG